MRRAAFIVFAPSSHFCLFLNLFLSIILYILIKQFSILLHNLLKSELQNMSVLKKIKNVYFKKISENYCLQFSILSHVVNITVD